MACILKTNWWITLFPLMRQWMAHEMEWACFTSDNTVACTVRPVGGCTSTSKPWTNFLLLVMPWTMGPADLHRAMSGSLWLHVHMHGAVCHTACTRCKHSVSDTKQKLWHKAKVPEQSTLLRTQDNAQLPATPSCF
jgi:hypothetical protein